MKAPRPPWAYVPAILGIILGSLACYWGWVNHRRLRAEAVVPEGYFLMPKENGALGQHLAFGEGGQLYWTNIPPKPKHTLGARNPKLSEAQQHLTSEDLDAMDAMKEGQFQEAAQILHETDRKPEDWLIELRKKWGSTNPDALLGPSWEEIQRWGEEKKP